MVIFFRICTGLSFIFSLLLVVNNIHGLAITGSIAGIVFSAALVYSQLQLKRKGTYISLVITRKLFDYWPFVMIACFICSRALVEHSPYMLDAILALLWFGIVILKAVTVHYLKNKNLKKYFPDIQPIQLKKKMFPRKGKKGGEILKSLFIELLEWVDAAFYAIFFVLLVNIFIFQVYRIPSESMVPEFMIGDTVIGVKTPSGPAFPLSSFRLPQWKHYKRGDIVILNNPNYPNTPKARLKTFMSQLVYMLTLAQVNINTDDNGKLKADPLVKRVTGLPGEKLMLVDGVLYVKHRGDTEFLPVEEDSLYAHWDLASLPESERRLIKDIYIGAEELRVLEAVESQRKELNLADAVRQTESLIRRLALLKDNKDTAAAADFLRESEYEMSALFRANDTISREILTTNGGLAWFRSFMTGWVPYWQSGDTQHASLYEKRFAQLNALIKLCFGKIVIRNIELFRANATAEQFINDEVRNRLLQEAQNYAFYLVWTNQRNMNVFPAGADEYIPENAYFMMGDNRFNSTDMRHTTVFKLTSVDKNDAQSIRFLSNIEPKYVPAEKILGTTILRVFPFSRFGAL
ncbi:signal peptidase I [Treponema sp. OMZ 305]|uniref:signal peptidase I n=1 Tax=Treponema TaxID=157 RepID=UPI001BAE8103|nr:MULTISPECIES: signal peptidase I [Treponema]QUY17425.1 signal peptidase I [Treponema vincentii]UTC57272.1 signal peptidase I [Treponema sp. OMZ 305]